MHKYYVYMYMHVHMQCNTKILISNTENYMRKDQNTSTSGIVLFKKLTSYSVGMYDALIFSYNAVQTYVYATDVDSHLVPIKFYS